MGFLLSWAEEAKKESRLASIVSSPGPGKRGERAANASQHADDSEGGGAVVAGGGIATFPGPGFGHM